MSTTRILVEHGDFKASPLPGDNPRSIIWSNLIEELYRSGLASGENARHPFGSSGKSYGQMFQYIRRRPFSFRMPAQLLIVHAVGGFVDQCQRALEAGIHNLLRVGCARDFVATLLWQKLQAQNDKPVAITGL